MLRRPMALISLLFLSVMLPLWAEDKPLTVERIDPAAAAAASGRPTTILTPTIGPLGDAAVSINTGATHQTIDGFGGEFIGYLAPVLVLNPTQIGQVLTLAFGEVQLTMGDADQLLEAPTADFGSAQDSNPGNALSVDQNAAAWGNNRIAWRINGWQGWTLANTHDNWINGQSSTPDGQGSFLTAKQLGFTNYYLGNSFPDLKFENRWLAAIRDSGNLTDYRNKVARQLLAYVIWYQQMYGEIPALMQLGNEEISGNYALFTQAGVDNYPAGGYSAAGILEMVDVIKSCGTRVDANVSSGLITLPPPKFLIGSEEREGISYELASAVLADPVASRYVGAIGYHEYPYGSEFSSLENLLLDAAGSNDAGIPGAPSSGAISIRNQLRDLAAANGVNVWLTEVSNGVVAGRNGISVEGTSFDALRGRAIDIHYNLIYANISAFMLQGAYFDTALEAGHFGQYLTLPQLESQIGPDIAVLADPFANGGAGQFDITTGGYAIGHYARWVKKGDIRVDASSSDPLVMVTAFTSAARGTISIILINNASQPRAVSFTLTGNQFNGNLGGEQSTNGSYWKSLGNIAPSDANDLTIILPALSVTSLSGPIL